MIETNDDHDTDDDDDDDDINTSNHLCSCMFMKQFQFLVRNLTLPSLVIMLSLLRVIAIVLILITCNLVTIVAAAWRTCTPYQHHHRALQNMVSKFLLLNILSCNLMINDVSSRELDASYRLVDQGLKDFRNGDVKHSLQLFDEAILLKPSIKPYLWQRGISLYYDNQFKQCSQQFHNDLLVNPADTEEIIWGALCDSGRGSNINDDDDHTLGRIQANMNAFSSLDRRPVMRVVYDVFRGTRGVQSLLSPSSSSSSTPSSSEYFYSQLYSGLYYEYIHDSKESLQHINQAADSSYCKRSNDYMCNVASNHRRIRTQALSDHH